jgi:hypothetical protein
LRYATRAVRPTGGPVAPARAARRPHLPGGAGQRPQKRVRLPDDEEVLRWLDQEFPRILAEARQRDAHLVFLDESGFQLTPVVRRTLWPRGVTPILPVAGRRDRISAISCITLSPRRYLPGLHFELLPTNANVNAERVVAFLRQLHESLPRFTVIWDQNRIHRKARLVQAFLAANPSIVAEDFPGYVPDLNPDEGVWGYTKYGRLPNFAPANAQELRERVDAELQALKRQAYSLYSAATSCRCSLTKTLFASSFTTPTTFGMTRRVSRRRKNASCPS